MIDETRARELAEKGLSDDDVPLGSARELREGWFFPSVSGASVGSHGVIVNKETGRLFRLGSAFSIERDLDMYDRGYQFDAYDLVIVAVRDLEATVRWLKKLGPTVVEPTEEAEPRDFGPERGTGPCGAWRASDPERSKHETNFMRARPLASQNASCTQSDRRSFRWCDTGGATPKTLRCSRCHGNVRAYQAGSREGLD